MRREQANFAILRSEKHKLVHFNTGFAPMLFDFESDPLEQNDLADDPAHTETLLHMTRELLSLRMRHMDQSMSELT